MTDEAQTPVDPAAAPAAVAQDAPAAAPAPEVAADPAAAPAAPQVDPVAAAPDAPDEDVEIDIVEIKVHNPAALRGIQAGPAPHPRTV